MSHPPIIREYTILEHFSPTELSKLVRIHMEQGWQPLGHALPAGSPTIGKLPLVQTMVKYLNGGVGE